ncbi:MAG: SHOCT domain-containing protein [Acidimicrobiia bacterium]|nr:SHOCT domain-containing protein [Acidimicrobiia bacterium]
MMDQMWGGSMMAVWLVFAVLLVVGVMMLVRALGERGGGGRGSEGSEPSALRILEERYAQGEIDRKEFEERRRTLRS